MLWLPTCLAQGLDHCPLRFHCQGQLKRTLVLFKTPSLTCSRPKTGEYLAQRIEMLSDNGISLVDLVLDTYSELHDTACQQLVRAPNLRRLALVGSLQLNAIPTSPNSSFPSLAHLILACCPVYDIGFFLPSVQSLTLGTVYLGAGLPALESLLVRFPNITKLELGNIAYSPGFKPSTIQSNLPVWPGHLQSSSAARYNHLREVVLLRLEHLNLHGTPIDLPVFRCLKIPQIRELSIKDLLQETHDKSIQFANPRAIPGNHLSSRRCDAFRTFVDGNTWDYLDDVEIYNVDSALDEPCRSLAVGCGRAVGGVKRLKIGRANWNQWRAIFSYAKSNIPCAPPSGSQTALFSLLPSLESLYISPSNNDHAVWVEGLKPFTRQRMALGTVIEEVYRPARKARY